MMCPPNSFVTLFVWPNLIEKLSNQFPNTLFGLRRVEYSRVRKINIKLVYF